MDSPRLFSQTWQSSSRATGQILCTMNKSTFTASVKSANSSFILLFTSRTSFSISWADIHLRTGDLAPPHALINKHYSCYFSLSGLWNNNKGDKVVFWSAASSGLWVFVPLHLCCHWSPGEHSPEWPHLRDEYLTAYGQETGKHQ